MWLLKMGRRKGFEGCSVNGDIASPLSAAAFEDSLQAEKEVVMLSGPQAVDKGETGSG